MKTIKKRSGNTYVYRGVFIIFIVVCIVTGGFCFQYYNRLQKTIRDESSGYLMEISRRIGSNIDRIIDDNYAVLNTLGSVIRTSQAESFTDIRRIVDTQKNYWNYQEVLFIDENGNAYNSYGKSVSLNNDTYFINAVINKKQGISATQMIDNQECIMVTIPVDDMVIDEKKMVALATSYSPAFFDKILSMTAFNGEAFSCIVSNAGTILVRSTAPDSIKSGYNVLTTIGESKLDEGVSIEKVKQDISDNYSGEIGFTLNGVRNYMVYMPISPENWYLFTFVPASAVNEKSDMLLKITLLIGGLITMAFAGLITFVLYISYRNKRKLEQLAYVDEVTGGNTIQKFYQDAEEALRMPDAPAYALVFTNFEKFKVLNEQFGRRACDTILREFYKIISSKLHGNECLGRQSADNFCILIEYEDEAELLKRFVAWYAGGEEYILRSKPIWLLPVVEFGVFVIGKDSIPFTQMIDRAKLALRESPHNINNRVRYAFYDDEVRRSLFREKHLEDMMEEALKHNEFQVYLQPQVNVADERIIGAEALTRWVSPYEGTIFPDEFIPQFEKNGFIVQLDLWVFEQVCSLLRRWIDHGLEPVKISVNCSRVHLKNPDFLNEYKRIAQQYLVPEQFIEIELTESVVMEDSERLTRVIHDIHSMGFRCSMDDFGSGYSSLNLIRSIPVDTLKLDKIFFRETDKDSSRTESVVGSIVSMAKALSMVTVAEGVEYLEQVEMLRKIGCDYIQGYVFAKPMPIADFERLVFGVDEK